MKPMLYPLIMSALTIHINVMKLTFPSGTLEIHRRCMYLSLTCMDVFVDMASCSDNKFYLCSSTTQVSLSTDILKYVFVCLMLLHYPVVKKNCKIN